MRKEWERMGEKNRGKASVRAIIGELEKRTTTLTKGHCSYPYVVRIHFG